jgi:capsular polysaccharide biosynthesis protein
LKVAWTPDVVKSGDEALPATTGSRGSSAREERASLVQSAPVRTEHEPPRTVTDPLTDLEAEREIDFGKVGRSIAARWWLLAAAVAVGAIAGYLASLGGGDVYVARTTLYLGQPTTPSGNAQVQSRATNPAIVNEIVRSEATVREVAREVGVDPGPLRRGIATGTVAPAPQTAARQGQNPLVQISVRGPWRAESAHAANLLADAVVTEVSGYVNEKVSALEDRLAAQERELQSIDARIEELQGAASRPGLSGTERLNVLVLISLAEQRRGILIEDRTDTEQLLTLAEEVERASQVSEAAAVKVPAQSPRSAIVVGALIGLLAGLVLALGWEPLLGGRSRRRAV